MLGRLWQCANKSRLDTQQYRTYILISALRFAKGAKGKLLFQTSANLL